MRFLKALPIWKRNLNKKVNCTCAFYVKFKKMTDVVLKITASNLYSAYINGEFISFGPSRSGHGIFRVDEISLDKYLKEDNVLFILVAGYNANNYWAINENGFLQAEILSENTPILWTGRDFLVREYTERIQNVCRFSLQRTFTENYSFNSNPFKDYLDISKNNWNIPEVVESGKIVGRKTHFPTYKKLSTEKIEKGVFIEDGNDKCNNICFDEEELVIFPRDKWASYSCDYLTNLKYSKKDAIGKILKDHEYVVYDLKEAKTGFINIKLDVLKESVIYVIFDEIDSGKNLDGTLDIDFGRDSCNKILEYKLSKGHYEHISFEPYSGRYFKILVISGEITNESISMILYENPDTDNFEFNCENKKLEKIMQAAINTFKQNAVDLLTDCPSRERAGWLCDAYFSAKAEQLFTGKNLVENDFLENYIYVNSFKNIPKGMIPMCYPSDVYAYSYIPNWTMWYIIELYDYALRTNNWSLVNTSYNKVKGIIEFFEKYINSYGLLQDLDGWVFIEWSKANDEEFIKGVNYPSNMLYSKALNVAGIMYNNEEWIKKSLDIAEKIRKYSFNGEFFEDNSIVVDGKLQRTGNISETCQYYAFFTRIASKEKYNDLFENLITNFGAKRDDSKVYINVYKSNAFIGNYLRLIMLAENDKEYMLGEECIDYFYRMAIKTGTLWEKDEEHSSLIHGFASYAGNLILDYLIGYKGRHNKEFLFSKSKSNYDCSIKIPVDNNEFLLFERKNNKEKLIIPTGYTVKMKNQL